MNLGVSGFRPVGGWAETVRDLACSQLPPHRLRLPFFSDGILLDSIDKHRQVLVWWSFCGEADGIITTRNTIGCQQ